MPRLMVAAFDLQSHLVSLFASPVARSIDAVDWSPGLGDPSFMGWFTVLAYFAAAWSCLRAFKTEKQGPERPYRQAIPAVFRVLRKRWPAPPVPARRAAMWLAIAVMLVALGINKQLDLQTLLTEAGRVFAYEGGWYGERRLLQTIFIGVVAVVGASMLVLGWWITRGPLRDFRLPLGGLAFIVCFVVIRAASFHHVDRLIGFEPGGVRLNWVFELVGIGLVALGAWLRIRRRPAFVGRVQQLNR